MLKEHAKLMCLLEQAGEISGRKKLQKIVYISKKFNFDFGERFNFHFYVPYSEELSLKIEELHHLGFISEKKEHKNGYTQYTYRLSEKGEEFLRLYPTEIKGLEPFIRKLNGESSRFLELVSTLLYFDHLPTAELISKVQKVKSKQNYTEEEIHKALNFIDELRALRQS
ncbi:YwgA family protein [Caldalkalibacillus thermarum TA2.A1]|uniref:YwgA family protein n=1 Tax=Caldalkalibacillus thermarum (strain TA2.A1) TaxID=986075 RepID=A0A8X8I4H0_CALTT|nr:YwgA family protein [Caldalkalibacillus thermarum]QZT34215.1 YwgA family protein [Caldalkalibacillus thermarum TA2.A1]